MQSQLNPKEQFGMYLDARRPLIYIRNFDFQAVDRMIAEVCRESYQIEEFSEADGRINFFTKSVSSPKQELAEFLSLFNSSQLNKDKNNYIVILKEVHDSLTDKRIYSLIQSIVQRNMQADNDPTGKNHYDVTLVIVDSKLAIPPELEKLTTMIEFNLPDDSQIQEIVEEMAKKNFTGVEEGFMPDLIMALKGLSEFEIRQIVNLAIANDGLINRDDLTLIHQEKRQTIQKTGLVEMVEVGNNDIGGLKKLRAYLKMNAPIFKNPGIAQENGVDLPAGVMIVGMPGCGKSLTAKCIAKDFAVPLLRLDVGRLMGKFVGESEDNLRRAIAVSEAASPCVLWIDEIEKAFAGIGESGGGGSVSTRMFGYFLTWMQEKKSCIYVVATANDISNLPPEFLRRGRFDEIFQVKFPNQQERKEIFDIQIKKRNHGIIPNNINTHHLAELLANKEKYSGADIESIVKEGMKQCFVKNMESSKREDQWEKLQQKDLEKIIKDTPSSYHSQQIKLDKMLEKLRELDVKSAT